MDIKITRCLDGRNSHVSVGTVGRVMIQMRPRENTDEDAAALIVPKDETTSQACIIHSDSVLQNDSVF